MDNENKGFPNGWGDNSEDDDDYGFVDDTDEYDEDSAWGNSSSPFKKSEPVTSPETNSKTSAQSESVTPNTNNEANDDTVHDASVQNVKQPESISSSAPTLNVSPNQGYVMQKQKTNPALIIVIIVLVLIVGILGGMFFMMIKDKKSDTSGENSSVSDAVKTTAEITEAPTESKTKTTTATVPVESTTQTTSSIPDQYSSEEISAMFSAYIAENPDPNRNYENADYGYALIDLNNDGVQELLITYDEVEAGSPGVTGIFNINNNSLESIWISDFRTLGKLCEDNYIYTSAIYGQGYGIFIYKYSSGDILDEVESIEYNASIGSDKALHNGSEVSQTEAEEILAKYNAKKFKTKQLKFEEKTSEVTEPDTSTLKNGELGRMYNEFYIYSLHGYISGGYIEDYNGDGVDDLIYWAANAGYVVAYYKNGTIEKNVIPNTDSYGYDEPLFGMKTQYYAWDELPDKCLEKAISCGFTANKDFYIGNTYQIGYVKTKDIDGTLNLRSAPSTDSDVLVQLPNGKLFNVIPSPTGNYGVYDDNGWYYISVNQNGNNYMGYISADYAVAWDNGI